MNSDVRGVWIFGDYRNYFQNRVTLQLIAKGRELARTLERKSPCWCWANRCTSTPWNTWPTGRTWSWWRTTRFLKDYQVETYTTVIAELIREFRPEILLGGATSFGRELFPRFPND